MACTEWTTILVSSQTCEPINFSQSPPAHKFPNQHARQLVNLSTRHLEAMSTFQ